MTKKIITLFVLAVLLGLPSATLAAATTAEIAPQTFGDYIYLDKFDNLLLDFKIDSAAADTFDDLAIKNAGGARDGFEIGSLVLWADDGNGAFDGFAVDTELATATYDTNSYAFVFQDVNHNLPAGVSRFFVSVATLRKGTSGKTFDFYIPGYNDISGNGKYESGDQGIFLGSKAKLPLADLTNINAGIYKTTVGDLWGPVIVMTNLKNAQTLTGSEFTISGKAKDQGGSFTASVDVCIDTVCHAATDTGSSFSTWEYKWSNIAAGAHTLYPAGKDLNGNATASASIAVNFTAPVVLANVEKTTVTVAKNSAPADGVDPVAIDIVLRDAKGELVKGKSVNLNEARSTGTVVIKQKQTDSGGKVQFKVRGTEAASVTLNIKTEDGDLVKDNFNLEFTKVAEAIDYTAGRWIKLADSTAVYFLDKNNGRHAYPNQAIWESYFGKDFSKVETVSAAEIAGYSLGGNVPFKAGVLLKIPSIAKVYYVSQNAKISWVTTEAVAISLYGSNWSTKVKDLSESFFTDYGAGANLD